ncbi:MAG: DinB family protein [Acidobacteriaceae bacterium]
MVKMLWVAVGLLAASLTVAAQQTTYPKPEAATTIASAMEMQMRLLESQFVPAAEAMPADKYNFTPSDGDFKGADFKGVRTFALEVKHVATANFVFYSAMLGQDPPAGVTAAGAGNGPDEIQTKEQILKYLKDSFALGHKALATLTPENAVAPLAKPPLSFLNTRLALASFTMQHAFDHYGQMVEYLRMNGIVPPSSQGQPLANPPK